MLSPEFVNLLDDPVLGEDSANDTLFHLLESEYLRRLARYQRTNRALEQKYQLHFQKFISGDVIQQKGYSWEVEQDAIDWETAIGGITTMKRKLRDLHSLQDAQDN